MMIHIAPAQIDWVLIRQTVSCALASGKSCRISGAVDFLNSHPHYSAFLSDFEECFQRYDFGRFELDGNDILFYPRPVRFGSFQITINPYSSAIEMMLLLMPALFSREFRSRLFLSGTTHSPFTFGTSWMKESFLALLERLGLYASCALRRFGFYGSGGGGIEAKVYPFESKKFSETTASNPPTIVGGRIYIAHLESNIALMEKEMLCGLLQVDAGKVGILEIRDCDGAWNHAEVYCTLFDIPIVVSETVPVYDFSGTFVFSKNTILTKMEMLAEKARAFIACEVLPEEMERELAPYFILTGNHFELGTIKGKEIASLTINFFS
jgi:hypothetical protein